MERKMNKLLYSSMTAVYHKKSRYVNDVNNGLVTSNKSGFRSVGVLYGL